MLTLLLKAVEAKKPILKQAKRRYSHEEPKLFWEIYTTFGNIVVRNFAFSHWKSRRFSHSPDIQVFPRHS